MNSKLTFNTEQIQNTVILFISFDFSGSWIREALEIETLKKEVISVTKIRQADSEWKSQHLGCVLAKGFAATWDY